MTVILDAILDFLEAPEGFSGTFSVVLLIFLDLFWKCQLVMRNIRVLPNALRLYSYFAKFGHVPFDIKFFHFCLFNSLRHFCFVLDSYRHTFECLDVLLCSCFIFAIRFSFNFKSHNTKFWPGNISAPRNVLHNSTDICQLLYIYIRSIILVYLPSGDIHVYYLQGC